MDGLINYGSIYPVVVGGVISLLLSIIAYFLHLLIQDIRLMKIQQGKLSELCTRLQLEQQFIKRWLKKAFTTNN
ncbi:hypothetical protein [Belliella buryatensis]|uniref:hypothetical protein n=1 Tax=Belliella buryatensis TaxID=1500549 RepID=UPI000B7852FF|nr:hypothetical protein [Belliella buryatensis]